MTTSTKKDEAESGKGAPSARAPRLPKGPPAEVAADTAEIRRRAMQHAVEKDAQVLAPFTPGPWSYSGRMIVDGRGLALAAMAQEHPRSADMRLIAAAPELYRILSWLRDSFTWFVLPDGAQTIIKDALASVGQPSAISSAVKTFRAARELAAATPAPPGRTQADVLEVLDRAIELASAASSAGVAP